MAKHKQKQEDPADPSNVAGLRQAAVDEPTVKREPTDSTKGFWANSKQVALEDKSSELSAREAELKRKLLASDTFKPAPAPVTISIFSPSPSGGLEEAKKIDVDVHVNKDNWDDADGYYNTRSNEIMNDRYEIVSSRGKGVFSTVLFAKDIKAGDNIRAIKMIRANDVMYRAGQKEIKIANSLSADDPHNKKHIVRLFEHFEHKGHLCMVFEPMYMNLREVLRQFGRGVGININAVQAYSKQLFIALQHMKNHGIIHCDLKPDNILVNRQKNLIRVCDLGSAMYLTEVEITPYVCSRFYRPPEVILGLPYDCSLDMWSIACCIFELFTGKIMFQGRTNNHMLKLHQEAPHLNPLSPPLARILSSR
jgi:serine/threonine-protein kinase PRP4